MVAYTILLANAFFYISQNNLYYSLFQIVRYSDIECNNCKSHKYCSFYYQNKKKAAVLSILYQRFILKSNRRYFPSLQFTSSQINFCNSPLVYRFYTQQKYKAYKTSLWTSIYTIFRIKNSIIDFVKNSLQISWNIAKRDWVKTHCLFSLKD